MMNNTITFTGKLPMNKQDCIVLAKSIGFSVTNIVTKDTKFVVASNIDRSWKLTRAMKLKIKIIPFKDWVKTATA